MNDHWVQVIAVVVAIGFAVTSRLVRALLVHQQKMTELLQRGVGTGQNEDRVLRELAELRALVAKQAVTLSLLAKNQTALPPLAERLEERA